MAEETAVERNERIETERADEEPEAVTGENARDLA